MRNRLPLCVLIACAAGLAAAQGITVGGTAPTVTLNDISGRPVQLRDLASQGTPYFLYFIDVRDDVSQRTSNVINRIVAAYSPAKVKWYGVINAREDRTRAYQAEFKPPYQLLMDRDMAAVKQFGLDSAPVVVEIGVGGKVLNVWRGLSAPVLTDINRQFARANGQRIHRVDWGQLPSTVQYGHPFVQRGAGGG